MVPHTIFVPVFEGGIDLAQKLFLKVACRKTCRNTVRVQNKPTTSCRELKLFFWICIKMSATI